MVSAGLTELGAATPSSLRVFLLALATRITITAHVITTGIVGMATVNVINSTDRIRLISNMVEDTRAYHISGF